MYGPAAGSLWPVSCRLFLFPRKSNSGGTFMTCGDAHQVHTSTSSGKSPLWRGMRYARRSSAGTTSGYVRQAHPRQLQLNDRPLFPPVLKISSILSIASLPNESLPRRARKYPKMNNNNSRQQQREPQPHTQMPSTLRTQIY
jgi:hypothetical protein